MTKEEQNKIDKAYQLRKISGAGIMDCKKALQDNE